MKKENKKHTGQLKKNKQGLRKQLPTGKSDKREKKGMVKKALGKGLDAIFGDDAKTFDLKRNTKSSQRRAAEPVAEEVIELSAANKANVSEENVLLRDAIYHEENVASDSEGIIMTETDKTTAENDDVSRETLLVSLSRIEPNRDQPRKVFEKESLQELADSMKRYGVLQPLLVKKNGPMYEIIAGERRWRAAKLAGLTEIPVIVRDFAKQEAAEIAIIENIQREDLSAVEEARAYQSLIREYGLTQEEVAERVSKNRSTITNSLRLLQLTDNVLKMLSDGQISAGHARALLTVSDNEEQLRLANEIIEKRLSVREAERLAKAAAQKKEKPAKEKEEPQLDMYLIDAARSLTEHLGTKVQIAQGKRGKGVVSIEYYSTDDLNKIIDRLRNES